MGKDLPETDKYVVYWKKNLPEKQIDILLIYFWIKCCGALRKMVGIFNMKNSFILCHIGTDYPFTQSKDRGKVVGSMPKHNVQCNL